jgi:hypothetical protein
VPVKYIAQRVLNVPNLREHIVDISLNIVHIGYVEDVPATGRNISGNDSAAVEVWNFGRGSHDDLKRNVHRIFKDPNKSEGQVIKCALPNR